MCVCVTVSVSMSVFVNLALLFQSASSYDLKGHCIYECEYDLNTDANMIDEYRSIHASLCTYICIYTGNVYI